MRVLGIDCGAERTGFGIIDSDGVTHQMIASGLIRTSPSEALPVRLHQIWRGLRDVISSHHPQVGAVEAVFYAVNVKTALKLAHVRGVALLAIAEAGVPAAEYSPLEIKTSVVGYGRAEKVQVQLMVRSLLKLDDGDLPHDTADALAVAICHATHWSSQQRREAHR